MQAGTILSIHKLLQSPLKLRGIQNPWSNSSSLLLRHFTSVFFSWEKILNWVKQMGSGYFFFKRNNSCLVWWLTCLEFWASISFPDNCHFHSHPKFPLLGADTDHGNTNLFCWSSLQVFQQENYFVSAVRVSFQVFFFLYAQVFLQRRMPEIVSYRNEAFGVRHTTFWCFVRPLFVFYNVASRKELWTWISISNDNLHLSYSN